MNFQIIKTDLLNDFKSRIDFNPLKMLQSIKSTNLSVDYFSFYKSVSAVYSSKIEGENIEFDSYYKHKFLNVEFKPDYTKKPDDLYRAYEFIEANQLNFTNLKIAHSIITSNLLNKKQQGSIRSDFMYVINNEDMIEYVAASPAKVTSELNKLMNDIEILLNRNLSPVETIYFASFIHLVFVKIHPFQDGNGRTARLLEKWFLIEKLGRDAIAIPLEKKYFNRLETYYLNLKKCGLEYDLLDYHKALDFLLMTVMSLGND
jgi:Fic family protein